MNSETQKIIQQRYEEVPGELQLVLTDPEFRTHIQNVAQIQNLSKDKESALENEVVLMFLAFESYKDLARNLSRELTVSPETGQSLADAIFERFFTPQILEILDSLEKGQVEADKETPPEETSDDLSKTHRESAEEIPPVPQYKKPLTQGAYRNANLYQNPATPLPPNNPAEK